MLMDVSWWAILKNGVVQQQWQYIGKSWKKG